MMAMKELKDAVNFGCTKEFWRMAVLWTISLLLSYLHLFTQTLFSRKPISYPRHSPLPTPTTSARPVCIITGATSGLGAAAAYSLSIEGFFVVLVGRSSYLLSKVKAEIRRRNKYAHIKTFQVDLSSFQSILKFKETFELWLLHSDMHSSVQLLINNAGMLATSSRLTAEGFDERLDQQTVSGMTFSRFRRYPCAQIYEYSKFCLLLFSYELHRQLSAKGSQQVSVIAVDPGAVKTNIMREIPTSISYVAFFVLKLLGLLQSPEDGVCSILDAALASPETSGAYFFGGKGRTINSSALSYDTNLAKELWATSCDLFQELQLASKDTPT